MEAEHGRRRSRDDQEWDEKSNRRNSGNGDRAVHILLWDGDEGMKCPMCNGTGVETDKVSGEILDDCEDCDGIGHVPDESAVYGNDCRGGRRDR